MALAGRFTAHGGVIMNTKYRALLVAALMLMTGVARAGTLYRQGCDFPLNGVQVCWEGSADEAAAISPFPEVHLLAVAQERAGRGEILDAYTRAIHQQLLAANFAGRLPVVWRPVVHLDDAITLVEREGWAQTLWIAPRVLRNSGEASPGVVDWDAYLLAGSGRVNRKMRFRVESAPHAAWDEAIPAAGAAGAVVGLTTFLSLPGKLLLAGGAGGVAANRTEPAAAVAGQSLELMTELAVRQLLWFTQRPLEELPEPDGAQAADSSSSLVDLFKKGGTTP